MNKQEDRLNEHIPRITKVTRGAAKHFFNEGKSPRNIKYNINKFIIKLLLDIGSIYIPFI